MERSPSSRGQNHFTRVWLGILLPFLLILAPNPIRSAVFQNPPAIMISDGWQYLWRHPASEAENTEWLAHGAEKDAWKPLKRLGWPHDRKDGMNLWLKVRLPESGGWRDPCLFVSDSLQFFKVFQNGRIIYQYGFPNDIDKTKTLGYRWHIIPLSPGFEGSEIVMNISSNGDYKGIMNKFVIGSRSEHIQRVILQDIDNIVAIALMFIVAVTMLLIYLQNRSQKVFLTTGLYSFFVCFAHISVIPIRQFFLDEPTFWFRVLILTLGLCWVFVGRTIELLFGAGYQKIFRRIWQIWLVFSVWILQYAIFLTYNQFFETAYFVLAVLTELSWISLIGVKVVKRDLEARILIVGIVVSLLFEMFFDLLVLTGISSDPPVLAHWGDIAVLAALSTIMGLRFRGVYLRLQETNVNLKQEIIERKNTESELENYKNTLEEQVDQRTEDLFQSNQRLIKEIEERKQSEVKRLELEKQLFQSQKMEAIGTLARGIAHDLNNSLGVILGYTEMMIDQKPDSSDEKEFLDQVYLEGERAANLVQQILTFSRVQEKELQLLAVSPLLKESIKMIRPTLPPNITISEQIADDCQPIVADASQFHQIVMNLCNNARHAMKDSGGVLTIGLDEFDFDDGNSSHLRLTGTRYLRLTVGDTGIGMTHETKERIFDPFFTTKEVGEGTGLGLSVVHGIVENHGGLIQVDSNPGEGTIFRVYFPIKGQQSAGSDDPPKHDVSRPDR